MSDDKALKSYTGTFRFTFTVDTADEEEPPLDKPQPKPEKNPPAERRED